MDPSRKIGVVLAGYAAALLAACVTVAIHVASMSGPEADASSGMYAFGDLSLFIAVFWVVALAPTGAALFFLRSYRRVWTVLSAVAVAIATTGLAALAVFVVGRTASSPSPLASWAGLAVLWILGAPLFAVAFLLAAFISPHRSPRVAFLAATAGEAAVCAYAAFIWLSPFRLH
jgi:hypothetical protein